MSGEIAADEATAILLNRLNERLDGEDNRLPPTAHNKLMFFIKKHLDERGIESDISLFWYMYGPVAAKNRTRIFTEEDSRGKRIESGLTASDISASEVAVRETERAADEALDSYFDRGLDGLVRLSYEDAPYEAQRVYLDLKDNLESEANENQATLGNFGIQSGPSIRSVLYDLVEAFPTSEYPSYQGNLHTWYRLLSAELDAGESDSSHALRLAEKFWRLFCLELACRENTGLDRDDIEAELDGVDGLEREKEQIRHWFRQLERQKTRRNARHDEATQRAGEALIAPQLGVELDT